MEKLPKGAYWMTQAGPDHFANQCTRILKKRKPYFETWFEGSFSDLRFELRQPAQRLPAVLAAVDLRGRNQRHANDNHNRPGEHVAIEALAQDEPPQEYCD